MAVKSREITAHHEQIGFLSGPAVEAGFVWLLRLAGVLLIVVSIVGSFYGLQGKAASAPARLLADLGAAWPMLLGALAAQLFLSVGQWGARQRARRDRRFWFVYLGLLAVSAGLNWIAFGPHLVDWGVPWLMAALAVIGGDAAAELVIVVNE